MSISIETTSAGSPAPQRVASTAASHHNVERLLNGPIGGTLWRLGEFAKVGDLGHTPVNAIYPTQDGRSWVCTTGCLFRPSLH